MNHKTFFFWGILGAFLSLIIEILLLLLWGKSLSQELSGIAKFPLIWFALVPSLTEETIKFFLITNFHKKLSNPKDIITGALALGLGFSFMEILLNILRLGELSVGLLGLLIVHSLTSVFIGYSLWKLRDKNTVFIYLVLLFNILIHIIYNSLVASFF